MLSAEVLKKLDGLSLSMRTAARGGAGGLRRSKALGSSVEFSDFRDYAPGDDIRHIDWNAYGRFERLFLKLFMEEQEAVTTLLVDASRSMGAKWEAACFLTEAIAYLALQGADRVRLVLLNGEKSSVSPLYRGRHSFESLSSFLSSQSPSGSTKLCRSIQRLDIPFQRGMSVLISDFFSEDGYREALQFLLYRKQDLSVLQLLSAGEIRPELEGAIRLVDSESREKLELLIGNRELEAYQRTLEAFQRELWSFCHSRGIAGSMIRSDLVEETFLFDLKRLMLIN